MTNCKICGSPSEKFASATIRRKYLISYLICSSCRFIQTEDPFWLAEAYSQPINHSDVGYVSRNQSNANITNAVISIFFGGKGRFVDYGGGWGLFVRLMRDIGHDFWRLDKYCPNLFAPDFEARIDELQPFELLTAFEVFEHLPKPLDEIQCMLEYSNHIFFSTQLQPNPCPQPDNWWYFGLDHGQHVSFYTLESLRVIARKLNLQLVSDGFQFHLLSSRPVSPFLFKLITRTKVANLLRMALHPRSLQPADFARAIENPQVTGQK